MNASSGVRASAAVVLSLAILLGLPAAASPPVAAATFTVNTAVDKVDVMPGDGVCATEDGECSLRAAVMEANALIGADEIRIPGGPGNPAPSLTLQGAGEDDSRTGDLDILDDLTISGDGMALSGAEASGLNDRALHVHPGVTVILSGVSFFWADAGGETGGGVLNEGTVSMVETSFQFNRAASGGGVTNLGQMIAIRSVVAFNTASTGAGGIWNTQNLTMDQSTVANNEALNGPGGGIANHGQLILRNSTVSQNRATFFAAGILNENGAGAVLNNSTIVYNQITQETPGAPSTGGLINRDGSSVSISNSILALNAIGQVSPDADCMGSIASAGYNLIGSLADCTLTGDTTGNQIAADPLLPAQPTLDPAQTWGYPPLPGSPAIDAGNPANIGTTDTSCEPKDQAGVSRPIGFRCDIGAYESEFGATATPSSEPTQPPITDTPVSTMTASITASKTPTLTPSPTPTRTNTVSFTPTFTPMGTGTPSPIPTSTDTATLTPTPVVPPYWTVWSDAEIGAFFGGSVALGDTNGDGHADAAIGAGSHSDGEFREGAAFLYFGALPRPDEYADWAVQSNQKSAALGNPLDSVGDVNGDGFADLVVSAYLYSHGEVSEGAVFAYYGSPLGPSETADWMVEGNQEYAMFGWAVAGAGDVNGDGYDDVIVGARYFDDQHADEGAAFLFLGSPSGLESSPAWRVVGGVDQVGMGYAVAGPGDVTGDGYDDVLVSSVRMEPTENEGTVYLFTGSPSGLSSSPVWSIGNATPDDGFGADVAPAGDVNDDGRADFLIGAPGDAYLGAPGRAYLFLGSDPVPGHAPAWVGSDGTQSSRFGATVASAGDFNADGYMDLAVGAPNYYVGGPYGIVGRLSLYLGSAGGFRSTPDWTFLGQNNSDFASSLARAADTNGDGYDDLLVGAQNWDNQPSGEGRAFIFFGWPMSPLAPPPTPGPSLTPWSSRTPIVTTTSTPTASPTTTPTTTPTAPPAAVFFDGFESGDLSAWSSAQTDGGDLSVTAQAAVGGAYGLQAVIDDNRAIYVVDDTPSSEAAYRARLYFDPNGISMVSGNAHVILLARDASGAPALRIDFRSFQGDYQLRGVAFLDVSPNFTTPWTTIPDAPHFVEVDWSAATGPDSADGTLGLWIDGELIAAGDHLDNAGRRIDSTRLGAVSGIDSGTRGTYFFDAFASTRGSAIGPDPSITLPPPPPLPDEIFTDGFESGDLAAWSAAKNPADLIVGAPAAMDGAYGLQVVVDDGTGRCLTDWSPVAERSYHARFAFDPNGLTMLDGRAHQIFQAVSGASKAVAKVEMRYKSGAYYLRAGVLTQSSGWTVGPWGAITDAPHVITIDWEAAESGFDGSFFVRANGIEIAAMPAIDNSGYPIDLVRLGAVAGVDRGTLGSMFFDAFASWR